MTFSTNFTSVTVGISAYNEQATIENTLRSILEQQGQFILNKVLVVCDGSTDHTPMIAKRLAKEYAKIEVVIDGQQLGKARRLNQLFSLNQSDVIVIVDADILILDSHLIEKLVQHFTSPSIGLVSANSQYLGSTFFGKITAASERLWYEARKDVNNGNNFYNNAGSTVALSKALAKEIELRPTSVDDQHWIYYFCIEKGYQFVFAADALTFNLSPATLADTVKYQSRSERKSEEEINLEEKLGNLAKVPRTNQYKALFNRFVHDPFFTLCAVVYLFMLRLIPIASDPLTDSGRWERLSSTKQMFTAELIEQARHISQELTCI